MVATEVLRVVERIRFRRVDLAVVLFGLLHHPAEAGAETRRRHQFAGPNAALERAVEDDDPGTIAAALRAGADVNARGVRGVTPAEYAVGTLKRQAAAALFRLGANPNLKDDEGDNAVTLAAKLYGRDPFLLEMALDAGGDPNTTEADNDPIVVRFMANSGLAAITMLQAHGANLNADGRGGRPIIISAAVSTDWDVVWHMIQLGADIDEPRTRSGLVFAFGTPTVPPPGSPLYADKVKVWRLLVAKGASPVPPAGITP